MDYAIGIDIGSTCAKTAVLAADGFLPCSQRGRRAGAAWTRRRASAPSSKRRTFRRKRTPVLRRGTGASPCRTPERASRRSPATRGACFLHGRDDLLVIDIGGQDTKKVIGVIRRRGAGLSY